MIQSNNKNMNNISTFKFDTSIVEKYIDNPEIVCFNDCALDLAISVLNINSDYFYSSTQNEFKAYLYSHKKNKYSKNELLALQMLVKYKSDTSFSSNSNISFITRKLGHNVNINKNENNEEIKSTNTPSKFNINTLISGNNNKFENSASSSLFV